MRYEAEANEEQLRKVIQILGMEPFCGRHFWVWIQILKYEHPQAHSNTSPFRENLSDLGEARDIVEQYHC